MEAFAGFVQLLYRGLRRMGVARAERNQQRTGRSHGQPNDDRGPAGLSARQRQSTSSAVARRQQKRASCVPDVDARQTPRTVGRRPPAPARVRPGAGRAAAALRVLLGALLCGGGCCCSLLLRVLLRVLLSPRCSRAHGRCARVVSLPLRCPCPHQTRIASPALELR